jgi:hypothetical protein
MESVWQVAHMEERCIWGFDGGNLKERYHWQGLGIDVCIISN